jgi:hypothetical protein
MMPTTDYNALVITTVYISVAELELVEPHHFAGAGARPKKIRLRLWSRVCKFIKNVTKTLNFSY